MTYSSDVSILTPGLAATPGISYAESQLLAEYLNALLPTAYTHANVTDRKPYQRLFMGSPR